MEGGADGLATINTIKSLTGFDMENLAPNQWLMAKAVCPVTAEKQ